VSERGDWRLAMAAVASAATAPRATGEEGAEGGGTGELAEKTKQNHGASARPRAFPSPPKLPPTPLPEFPPAQIHPSPSLVGASESD
jgi:hypothetical protein